MAASFVSVSGVHKVSVAVKVRARCRYSFGLNPVSAYSLQVGRACFDVPQVPIRLSTCDPLGDHRNRVRSGSENLAPGSVRVSEPTAAARGMFQCMCVISSRLL